MMIHFFEWFQFMHIYHKNQPNVGKYTFSNCSLTLAIPKIILISKDIGWQAGIEWIRWKSDVYWTKINDPETANPWHGGPS